ncbi:MAG: ATP-binding protein [Halieaceae bacterium]|jgi:predicted AAA+ superfamily ATPase|nr:ATP-binding protein [Halieaceae bacterium]
MGSRKKLVKRLHGLIDRLETLLPENEAAVDWSYTAYQWRDGRLQGVAQPHLCALDDLLCMQRQKTEVLRNVRRFLGGRPANHVLLWGARGTGKSTLIKAVFHELSGAGLRLLEMDAAHLHELPRLAERIRDRDERFLLYCDDLSFEADDPSYKTFKAMLEGSIAAPPENLLICATSNRRHLMPEFQQENQETRYLGDEVHPGESVEEKVSLSERFGLWLSFYPFRQEEYLQICGHWLQRLSGQRQDPGSYREAAVQWAQQRGARSGRVARQFAIDHLAQQD